jgi:hypothetical protein
LSVVSMAGLLADDWERHLAAPMVAPWVAWTEIKLAGSMVVLKAAKKVAYWVVVLVEMMDLTVAMLAALMVCQMEFQ